MKKQNPCSHPLIKLAKENGIKAVPMKDIFKYRNFKRSKAMSSWTSTHAMLTVVFVGYYYMAKILDIPYDVTFFPKNK